MLDGSVEAAPNEYSTNRRVKMVGPVLNTSVSGYNNRMAIAKNRSDRRFSKNMPSQREFVIFGPFQKNNGFLRIQRNNWFKHGVVTG